MSRTELLLILAAYLNRWKDEDAEHVPPGATAPVRNVEELTERAFDLSNLELKMGGPSVDRAYLRELALTLSSAAARLRFLNAVAAASGGNRTLP